MTITELIKKYGIDIEVYDVKRFAAVHVEFTNNGKKDETWLVVESVLTETGTEQLTALYEKFCEKKHIVHDSVTSVSVVSSADTEKELQENAWRYQCFSEIYQRKEALEYKKRTGKTKYLYDERGNEYWYVESDERRHYTSDEG